MLQLELYILIYIFFIRGLGGMMFIQEFEISVSIS